MVTLIVTAPVAELPTKTKDAPTTLSFLPSPHAGGAAHLPTTYELAAEVESPCAPPLTAFVLPPAFTDGANRAPLSAIEGACASILINGSTSTHTHTPAATSEAKILPPGAKNVVTLRASTINNMALVLSARPLRFSAALAQVISARPAEIFAASSTPDTEVAILDSGATHHLWHSHEAFISYRQMHNQYVTLADNSKIPIAVKGVIAINMGGKNVVIRDIYHVSDLPFPLFSLRVHRRILGCGYHSNNEGVLIFPPSFSLEVDDEVDNYVTCHFPRTLHQDL